MPGILKLLLYTLLLNVIRYYPIGWMEGLIVFEPMHAPMVSEAGCFGFREEDLWSSYLFNYVLWLAVVLNFHTSHHQLSGKLLWKSLQSFGISCLLFCSLAAVYMNHFNLEIRTFFIWSMVDALILFGLLGAVNGLLYPLFFKKRV